MLNHAVNIRVGLWIDDLCLGVKEGLKAAARLEAEGAGLDAFGPEISPRSLGQSGRRDLARYVRSQGLVPVALRADLGGRRLADHQSLDANLTRIREAVDLAADLGAARLVIPAGYIAPEKDKEHATERSALREAAAALVDMTSRQAVRICWLAGSEPPETLAVFLNSVDSGSALEVDLNPGGFEMRGIDPLKALNALNSRVGMVRVADHFRGGGEAQFGSGDVRWGELLVGLSTLQRPAPIDMLAASTLDGDRVRSLTAACARLKALRRNPMA